MTVEQIIIALSALAHSREDLFPAKGWDRRFLDSITDHIIRDGSVSTEQARIFIAIAGRHVVPLASSIKVKEETIRASLATPTFQTEPFVSPDIPREIIRAGYREIALRFKRNADLITKLGNILQYTHAQLSLKTYDPTHKIHFVNVNIGNVNAIVDAALEFGFEIGPDAIGEIESVLLAPERGSLTRDGDGDLIFEAPTSRQIWTAFHPHVVEQIGTYRYRVRPPPALLRALKSATTLPLDIGDGVFDDVTEPGEEDDPALAVAMARLRDQDLRAVILTRDVPRAVAAILPVAREKAKPTITVAAGQAATGRWRDIAAAWGYAPSEIYQHFTGCRFEACAPFVIVPHHAIAASGPVADGLIQRRGGLMIFHETLFAKPGGETSNVQSHTQMMNCACDFEAFVLLLSDESETTDPGEWQGTVLPLSRRLRTMLGDAELARAGMMYLHKITGNNYNAHFADYAKLFGMINEIL